MAQPPTVEVCVCVLELIIHSGKFSKTQKVMEVWLRQFSDFQLTDFFWVNYSHSFFEGLGPTYPVHPFQAFKIGFFYHQLGSQKTWITCYVLPKPAAPTGFHGGGWLPKWFASLTHFNHTNGRCPICHCQKPTLLGFV